MPTEMAKQRLQDPSSPIPYVFFSSRILVVSKESLMDLDVLQISNNGWWPV